MGAAQCIECNLAHVPTEPEVLEQETAVSPMLPRGMLSRGADSRSSSISGVTSRHGRMADDFARQLAPRAFAQLLAERAQNNSYSRDIDGMGSLNLSNMFVTLFAEVAESYTFRRGDEIIGSEAQAFAGNRICALESGDAVAQVGEQEIRLVSAGEFFDTSTQLSVSIVARRACILRCLSEKEEKSLDSDGKRCMQTLRSAQREFWKRTVHRWRFSHVNALQEVRISEGFVNCLADCSEEVRVAANEPIIREGDAARSIFVLTQGSAMVYKGLREIALLSEGEIFGEGALPSDDRQPVGARAATIKALEPVVALQIEASAVAEALETYPGDRRRLQDLKHVLATRWQDRAKSWGNVKLLKQVQAINEVSFSSAFLDALAEGVRERRYAENDVIVEEYAFDRERSIYVLIKGTAVVVKNGIELARLSSGELFGERAALRNEQRVTSIVAITDCVVQLIPQSVLERALSRFPAAREDLARLEIVLARRWEVLATANVLDHLSLVHRAGLDEHFSLILAQHAIEIPQMRGTEIFAQGQTDLSRALCTLSQGYANVYRDGRYTRQVTEGQLFGMGFAVFDPQSTQPETVIVGDGGATLISIPHLALAEALAAEPDRREAQARLQKALEEGWNAPAFRLAGFTSFGCCVPAGPAPVSGKEIRGSFNEDILYK